MTNLAQIHRPLLVLIGGKPGTGKSTLAQQLAQPEQLGLPLLSRDTLKVGLVETYALAGPTADRERIESDERRAIIVPTSFTLFHATITLWLRAGVSLIAEHAYAPRTEAMLNELVPLAQTVFIECHTSAEQARRRFFTRECQDPRHVPSRLAAMAERVKLGTDPWATETQLRLAMPTLCVDTSDGYQPPIAEVVHFCRMAMGAGENRSAG